MKKSHLKEEIEEALPFSYTEKSVIFRSLPPLNLWRFILKCLKQKAAASQIAVTYNFAVT